MGVEQWREAVESFVYGNAGRSASLGDDLEDVDLDEIRATLAVTQPSSGQAPLKDENGRRDADYANEALADLWGDMLRMAFVSSEESAANRVAKRMQPDTTASVAHIGQNGLSNSTRSLEQHLSTLDPEWASSIRSSLVDLLSAAEKSDNEIATSLAELLGFQMLDLVGEVVSNRAQVALELSGAQQEQPQPTMTAQPASSWEHPAPVNESVKLSAGARPYVPGAQVRVQSAQDVAQEKALRAAKRRLQKDRVAAHQGQNRLLSPAEMDKLRQQELLENANRPLFTSSSVSADQPKYPHVFSSGASGNTLSVFGSKFSLPVGTSRSDHKEYEEVTIPPPRAIPMRHDERLRPISEMDPMCQGAFPGYKSLNRLQSVVYPLGYGSNENLLVCAPTGAGKTDVAMLTVLRAIAQHADDVRGNGNKKDSFGISLDDFKIIYVAPMKALAAEIVRKFSKRLAYLGVKVRELTGDMQMTRQEIAETQMIVTTPEKWDVVTRKPTGEGELALKVRLLIIDEVHLLHEDRGAVIETIVARTLRLVESSQSLIRIVGLSATLPNYVDVADFLRVNRYQGLFYFDSSFRPVPLEQHFLGIKGKPGSPQARANLDKAAFLKVEQLLHDGHQVMIFVHARKETVKSALSVREMCRSEGIEDLLLSGREEKEGQMNAFKREMTSSRNKEMKELFESGLGIHHAGMLRSDRTLSERMFEAGITRVLCCTSTLAWGVNLPAYAVLIKGTEVYDSGLGRFTDLSILDVLQIFGRAGRPQYEDLGVGFILTPQEKLTHYVDAITSQHPIESKFDKGLIDSLNAECALGTVQSVNDGIAWLSYTYLFTRMRRNPLAYGMSHDEVVDDPHIGAKRLSLIKAGAKALIGCHMLELDQASGKMAVTDLGRIAARYYIPWRTVEIFNSKLRSNMTEADVLSVLSHATDFEQIIPRDAEEKELKKLLEAAPCEVPGGIETSPGKTNILLQAYISRTFIEDFALASDMAYVAQNTGRIIRALFEISLSNRWSGTTLALMSMSKSVERRLWPFAHPLAQSSLNPDTLYNIQRWADEVEIKDLAQMDAQQIGDMIHLNERIGGAVQKSARQFPHLNLTYRLKPLTHDQIRVTIYGERAFEWNERVHGALEPFYIWIEAEDGLEIQQWSRVLFHAHTQELEVSFTLNVPESTPAGITLRWVSDGWLGAEGNVWASFDKLVMPPPAAPTTPLLDLPLLPLSAALALLPSETRAAYSRRFLALNAVQTQVFHTAMHSKADMFLSAPVASGKTTLVELAIWRTLHQDRAARVLVLVPHHRLLLQQAARFAQLHPMARSRVAGSPQEVARDDRSLREEVVFALPEHVLQILTGSGGDGFARRFKLVVAESLHMMSATYELALTRIRDHTVGCDTRLVATSASLHDSSSLCDWLAIKETSRFSFHAQDNPMPLQLSTQSFDLAHSLALLKLMAKPTFDKVSEVIRGKQRPAIVFVPSRRQCFATAGDLVTKAASEMQQSGFLGVTPEEVEGYLEYFSDERLYEPLLHGIGIYHDGMLSRDRTLMLELYESGVIKVLLVSRESCWSLPVRAGLVVIMGTRFVQITRKPVQAKADESTSAPSTFALHTDRKITDYPVVDLLRMMSLAVSSEQAGECFLLCQSEHADHLSQTLREGLTLESELLDARERTLAPSVAWGVAPTGGIAMLFVLLRDIASGRVHDAQDILDGLAGTYLSRRVELNPAFYDSRIYGSESVAQRTNLLLSSAADDLVTTLHASGLIEKQPAQMDRLEQLTITPLGRRLMADSSFDDLALLLEIHAQGRTQPVLASAMSRAVLQDRPPQVELGSAISADRMETALCRLTERLPSSWSSAFHIPRPKRGSKGTLQKRGQSGTGSDASEISQAPGDGPKPDVPQVALEGSDGMHLSSHGAALLMAAFFASVPVAACSDDACASHLADTQTRQVLDLLRELNRLARLKVPKQS
ncbi:unnamed protein product [Parajaminaea phylloscopi]